MLHITILAQDIIAIILKFDIPKMITDMSNLYEIKRQPIDLVLTIRVCWREMKHDKDYYCYCEIYWYILKL